MAGTMHISASAHAKAPDTRLPAWHQPTACRRALADYPLLLLVLFLPLHMAWEAFGESMLSLLAWHFVSVLVMSLISCAMAAEIGWWGALVLGLHLLQDTPPMAGAWLLTGLLLAVGLGLRRLPRVTRAPHQNAIGIAVGLFIGLAAGMMGSHLNPALHAQEGMFIYTIALALAWNLPLALSFRVAAALAGLGAGRIAVKIGMMAMYWAWLWPVEPVVALLGLVIPLLSLQPAWLHWLILPLLWPYHQICSYHDFRRLAANSQVSPTHLWFPHALACPAIFLPSVHNIVHYLLLLEQHHPIKANQLLAQLPKRLGEAVTSAMEWHKNIEHLQSVRNAGGVAAAHRLVRGHLGSPAQTAAIQQLLRISLDTEQALQQTNHYSQRLMLSEVEERLNRLILELGRNVEVSSLQVIAVLWRNALAEAQQRRTQLADERQEIENPYVVGVPLSTKQEIFVGRQDVIARIEKILSDRNGPPLLLHGQRRTGKTSLLHNLSRLMSIHTAPVYLDFQSPRMLSGQIAVMLEGLAKAISTVAHSFAHASGGLPPLTADQLRAGDAFVLFNDWLDHVEARLAGRTMMLALDEFVVLEDLRQRGKLSENDLYLLLSMFRHIIQHRQSFRLLLASSHTLNELGPWAGHLNNVQVVHLGYLSEEETRRLTEKPTPEFGLRYLPDARAQVYTLTHGHPALVQLLCSEIVELKNSHPPHLRRVVSFADIMEAKNRALATGEFFFQDIVKNQINSESLALLRTIATAPDGVYPYTRQPPGIQDLLRRDLVETCPKGYRFQVEMIRLGVLRQFGQVGAPLAGAQKN